VAADSSLRSIFDGVSPVFERAREFSDTAYLDLFASTTRELTEWESEYGVYPRLGVGEPERRTVITGRKAATGGQSPAYMQATLRAAGFDVYIHECWESTSPFVPRDPRDYTDAPFIGTHRCGAPGSRCGAPTARCNRFLTNQPGYWQTLRWAGEAPDPVPDDPAFWPYFIYLGGETFGTTFDILESRWLEFQWLVQQIKPSRHWVVVFANIIGSGGGIFDATFSTAFE
jgi:hypothetical protein